MYIYLKDKANNVSVTTDKSTAKITVDRTAPVINTFTLTGKPDEGQQLSDSTEYTHKVGITYNASLTESNIDSYCIYEDSCSYQPTNSTTLNTNYTLKDTEGSHTVNIRVKDKAGNESEILSKTITLDKTNPVATIKENSVTTESITVTVGYEGQDSIIKRQCKLDSESTWTDAKEDGSCTINNLSDGTPYTIEGRVRDASGRWNTDYPSVTVTTEYGYKCDIGELTQDSTRGWICTGNAKSQNWGSTSSYWTCSTISQTYSSYSEAYSACSERVAGTCSQGAENYRCEGIYYSTLAEANQACSGVVHYGNCAGTEYSTYYCQGYAETYSYGQCLRVCPTSCIPNQWQCYVDGSPIGMTYTDDALCRQNCSTKAYVTQGWQYVCSVNNVDYDDFQSCSLNCAEYRTTGVIEEHKNTTYRCPDGWSVYSGSNDSLVCYREATR